MPRPDYYPTSSNTPERDAYTYSSFSLYSTHCLYLHIIYKCIHPSYSLQSGCRGNQCTRNGTIVHIIHTLSFSSSLCISAGTHSTGCCLGSHYGTLFAVFCIAAGLVGLSGCNSVGIFSLGFYTFYTVSLLIIYKNSK